MRTCASGSKKSPRSPPNSIKTTRLAESKTRNWSRFKRRTFEFKKRSQKCTRSRQRKAQASNNRNLSQTRPKSNRKHLKSRKLSRPNKKPSSRSLRSVSAYSNKRSSSWQLSWRNRKRSWKKRSNSTESHLSNWVIWNGRLSTTSWNHYSRRLTVRAVSYRDTRQVQAVASMMVAVEEERLPSTRETHLRRRCLPKDHHRVV